MDGPERRRVGEVLEHGDEAHHRADDPHGRREARGLLEGVGVGGVAVGHAVDLHLHDLAHDLGVGAVDHELHALAGELVVDVPHVLVQREEPLAPGPLGEVGEHRVAPDQVELLPLEGLEVQRGDRLDAVEGGARHRGPERAAEHDERGGHVEQADHGRALDGRADGEQDDRAEDADGGDGLHALVVIGARDAGV